MIQDLLLLIISSPSGAGKTTLTRRLLAQFSDLTFSVSHTTRTKRPDEKDHEDYHFVGRSTFEEMIANGEFAEWARVHGNLYGTGVSELERARKEGRRGILFDVDYQGARQIKSKYPDAVAVFILPPTLEELRHRLISRGSEDAAAIQKRFEKARDEIEHYPFFDYLIVNKELDEAEVDLCAVVHAERCRRWRMAKQAEALLISHR